MEQIINQVCHVSSHENVELVEWEGKARLAHPHLETWEKRGVPHLQGQVPHTPSTPQERKNLCLPISRFVWLYHQQSLASIPPE